MSIKTVWIVEGCTACGLCGNLCPEVLCVNGKAKVLEGVNYAEFENLIKGIAECCPAEVIKYSDQKKLIDNLFSIINLN
jgi:ferredoxin